MFNDKLHIVVCLKYTISSAGGKLGPGSDGKDLPMAISPFDEYAVEEGVRIRERLDGKAAVTALTMGPAKSEDGLRDAISRGCDQSFLLTAPEFEGSDTYATAYILCKGLERLSKEKGPVDLVICGKQTNDSDTGQVGPALAAHWGVPSVTAVRKVQEIQPGSPGKLVVHRMMEDGAEVLECRLPAVLSIVKEINEPRIPSLKGKMAARKAQIPCWGLADIAAGADRVGANGSLVSWGDPHPVPQRMGGEKIAGATAQELAQNLYTKLKENGLL